MISVTVVPPDEALEVPWDDLSSRASNAFMSPAALKAAQDTMLAMISVLLAWDMGVEPARLVGLWALQVKSFLPLWPAFLDALPYPYAFISTPVVDPLYADRVMPAFFAAIAKDPKLPNVVWMQDVDADGPAFAAMQDRVAASRLDQLSVKTRLRPVATREHGVKATGSSTRRKLRQDWNRLAKSGAVEVTNARNEANVVAAMEVFLRLEYASWKGREGTALLCNPRDAAFARRFVGNLASRGEASVALLSIDGRPIAAQVLLYCGRTAYTWKPAFDEAYAHCSPGSLLVDRITSDLLAGEFDLVDSCASEESYMGKLWSGRKPVASLLVNVAPGLSPAFMLESAHRRGHEMLRALRDRLRERPTRAAEAVRQPLPDDRDIA